MATAVEAKLSTPPSPTGAAASSSPGGANAWVLPVKCRLEEAGISETRLLLLRRAHLDELHCKLGWLFNLRGRYQLKYLDKFGDLITFSSDEEFQLALGNFLPPEFRILVTPADGAASASTTARTARRQWTSRPLPSGEPASSSAGQLGLQNSKIGAAPAPASIASATAPTAKDGAAASAASDAESSVSAVDRPPVRQQQQQQQPTAAQSDRRAAFHPDYLRPRTATQRKSMASRQPAVQASLAGYRQDLADRIFNGKDFVHFGIECSRCGLDPLIGWRYKCSLCPNYNMCAACFDSYSHGHGFFRLP